MNDSGMTAFMDAMIFIIIIMMAISATIMFTHDSTDSSYNPDSVLEKIIQTDIRLSDMSEEEDDTLLSLPNMMAYSLYYETEVDSYLSSILDPIFGESRYRLSYTYEDASHTIGGGHGECKESSSRTVALINGEKIVIELKVY